MNLSKCSKVLYVLTRFAKICCYFIIGSLIFAIIGSFILFNSISFQDNKMNILDGNLVLEIKDDKLLMTMNNNTEDLEVDNINTVKKVFTTLNEKGKTKIEIIAILALVLTTSIFVLYLNVAKNFEKLFKNFLEEKIFTDENEGILGVNAKYVLIAYILNIIIGNIAFLGSKSLTIYFDGLIIYIVLVTLQNIFMYARTNK